MSFWRSFGEPACCRYFLVLTDFSPPSSFLSLSPLSHHGQHSILAATSYTTCQEFFTLQFHSSSSKSPTIMGEDLDSRLLFGRIHVGLVCSLLGPKERIRFFSLGWWTFSFGSTLRVAQLDTTNDEMNIKLHLFPLVPIQTAFLHQKPYLDDL